ncbi:MAG: SPFH domain-containing protein [Planctomycetes bacterium]|jgi:regulator of protease activity HflC (stomatin/prohibitin superfamily)|nr:SPFH domain-containing protein [Planctomycetota bacterium]MCC7064862.1 SPFH domain-containing protein [Planctomycetota bacterium]
MNQPSREILYSSPGSGLGRLFAGILLLVGGIAAIPIGASMTHRGPDALGIVVIVLGVIGIVSAILTFCGLVLVNPNQSKVVVLFGDYKGTLRSHGFFWVNPFSTRRVVSLRAHNFNSDKLKVNDLRGNPIEIGAVVVWRVRDTAQAAFDVEDYESYVQVQTESALRHMASLHPYDTPHDTEVSLRGSSETVNIALQKELTQRLQMAGIEVLEVRLSHLAYAPEIAGAMLQRQQAEAIIDARTRIVEGAVGMVQMALEQLKSNGVIDLDEERKAQMVSNLLVVLCSERGTQPVVNAGTLYG